MKRERWTESDVLSLPAGEQDFFERKGARLLDDKGNFLDALAKACSAFANSGGGSVLLGVEDGGELSGVEPLMGKEPMRDWLEQKLPALLDYSLSDFRVHVVERASESIIPADKIVVVIDVGDSALAPHQSRRNNIYYHRVAGRSVAAPHFYLDLLRQRLASPALEFGLTSVLPTAAHALNGGIFVELKLCFQIRNTGRAAAYKWRLRTTGIQSPALAADEERTRDYYFGKSSFPVQKSTASSISIDDTILPDDVRNHRLDLGVFLSPKSMSKPGVMIELMDMIGGLIITYQLATESSPGAPSEVPLADHTALQDIYSKIVEDVPILGLPA